MKSINTAQIDFYAKPTEKTLDTLKSELYRYLQNHVITKQTYDCVYHNAILDLEEIAQHE